MTRRYTGWRVVKNTVLEFVQDGENTTHTAEQIARLCDLNPGSVRIAANYLGVKLKPAPRGGRRYPCNQHQKRKIEQSVDKCLGR
jgi:hypothetical protein